MRVVSVPFAKLCFNVGGLFLAKLNSQQLLSICPPVLQFLSVVSVLRLNRYDVRKSLCYFAVFWDKRKTLHLKIFTRHPYTPVFQKPLPRISVGHCRRHEGEHKYCPSCGNVEMSALHIWFTDHKILKVTDEGLQRFRKASVMNLEESGTTWQDL